MVWATMLGSLVIYAVVCAVVVGVAAAAPAAAVSVRYGLSVVGIAFGALSLWWRRYFLATDPASPAPLTFAQLQSHAVIVWALSEVVGICGLLTALTLNDAREYLPFGAAAAALLLLHRPSNLPWARCVTTKGLV